MSKPVDGMDGMLKVAIVGCGKIADAHASQIQRIEGCEIVGVCDREPLMAKQLYERFPVKSYFTDLAELVDKARPDVVHITTPAESHFDVARFCLEQGCHVYVEKPFTLYAEQAQHTRGLGRKKGGQTNGRTQRPIQPCSAANESTGAKRLLGRTSCAHGKLLFL